MIIACRNIKTVDDLKPPAAEDEIRASSQFTRKLSDFARPSDDQRLVFPFDGPIGSANPKRLIGYYG
jgi:hypothetical protein